MPAGAMMDITQRVIDALDAESGGRPWDAFSAVGEPRHPLAIRYPSVAVAHFVLSACGFSPSGEAFSVVLAEGYERTLKYDDGKAHLLLARCLASAV